MCVKRECEMASMIDTMPVETMASWQSRKGRGKGWKRV